MHRQQIPSSTKASSRLGRLDAYWCAVVVICIGSLGLRLWFSQFFTWFSDDWTYFVRANTLSFPRFLLESYNGHIGAGGYLLIWLLNVLAPLSFEVASAVAGLMAVAAVALWAAAFRRIFGARPVLLVPIVVLAFSPTLIWSDLWWASAIQVGPLQICLAAVVFFAAGWAQAPSMRRLIQLLAAFAIGLLFWEKALFALAPIFAVIWMLLPGTSGKRLRAARPAFLATGGLCVVYLLFYMWVRTLYPGAFYAIREADPDLSPAGLLLTARGAGAASRDALAPALVGGPWGSVTYNLDNVLSTQTPITTACGVVLLALLVAGALLRRHGLVPVLMVVVYVGVVTSLIVSSTMGAVLGIYAMKNPRLFADSLSVTWLGVALLLLPTVTERAAGVAPWRGLVMPRLLARGAIMGFVVIAALGTFVGLRALLGPLQDHSAPRAWVETLRHDTAGHTSVLLVDARPPADVYQFGYWPEEAWLSKMLAGLPGARFSGSGDALYVVGTDGHLQRSRVVEQSSVKVGPVADCGYAVGAGTVDDLPLTLNLYEWNWGMQASFVAGQRGDVTVTVDGVPIAMSVPKGVSTLYAPINSPVSEVSVRGADTSGTVCLVEMKFGPLEPDPD